MLNLTRKVDYGMIAVAHLCTLPNGELASAREIAAGYGIPAGLLANILQDLARAGIVQSMRGTKGGYGLARDPAEITALHVFEALQGRFRFAECTGLEEAEETSCQTFGRCPVKGAVGRMHARIRDVLEDVTFADAAGGRPSYRVANRVIEA